MIIPVKNFLSKDELNLSTAYWNIKKPKLKVCPQVKGAFSDYSDTLGETILTEKQKLVEEKVGEKLLPTYTFTRLYKKGTELKKHIDRPSCEVSVSINFYADKEWPLWFHKLNKPQGQIDTNVKPEQFVTQSGDGIIYEGMNYEHWREPYEGEECMQIFIHYVRANGPYKLFHRDGRIDHNETPEERTKRIWGVKIK